MSPELERLLAALYELETCEPKHMAMCRSVVDGLFAEALARKPGLSPKDFRDALNVRYMEFRRKQRKPPTVPPKA